MAKSVVFVMGASGNIGSATVAALAAKYADKVEIRAGVRDPAKADKLKSLAQVKIVQATMGDKEKLPGILKGVDALFIVTPGAQNRLQLVVDTAVAANEAGVKHLLMISAPPATVPAMEDAMDKLSLSRTYIKLPYFIDNLWGLKETISSQGVISCSADPDKPFIVVSAEDAGVAGAAILVDPSKHIGRSYVVISCRITFGDVAREFSKVLGKEVKYNRLSYEGEKQEFLKAGVEEWKADVLIWLMKAISDGEPEVNPVEISDYETITGKKPTSLPVWIEKYGQGFQ